MIDEICMDKPIEYKYSFPTPSPSTDFNISSIIYNDQEICSNQFNKSEEYTTITFEQNFNVISDAEEPNCQVDYETLDKSESTTKYSKKLSVQKATPMFSFFQWLKASTTFPLFKSAPERVTNFPPTTRFTTTRRSVVARDPISASPSVSSLAGLPEGSIPEVSNNNKNSLVQITNIYIINNSSTGAQNVTFESINNSNTVMKVLTQLWNAFRGTPAFRSISARSIILF